jgi:hypothetical protein
MHSTAPRSQPCGHILCVQINWLLNRFRLIWRDQNIEIEHKLVKQVGSPLVLVLMLVPPESAGGRSLCDRVGCDLVAECEKC